MVTSTGAQFQIGVRDLVCFAHSPSYTASNPPSWRPYPDTRTMDWSDSLEYVNFRQTTRLNYHHIDNDYAKLTAQAIKFVHEDLPTGLLSARDDASSLLELGIRYPVS